MKRGEWGLAAWCLGIAGGVCVGLGCLVKPVKEAMELQVASRGGNKRKYALADINADIAIS
jgi:hypothetical protein